MRRVVQAVLSGTSLRVCAMAMAVALLVLVAVVVVAALPPLRRGHSTSPSWFSSRSPAARRSPCHSRLTAPSRSPPSRSSFPYRCQVNRRDTRSHHGHAPPTPTSAASQFRRGAPTTPASPIDPVRAAGPVERTRPRQGYAMPHPTGSFSCFFDPLSAAEFATGAVASGRHLDLRLRVLFPPALRDRRSSLDSCAPNQCRRTATMPPPSY